MTRYFQDRYNEYVIVKETDGRAFVWSYDRKKWVEDEMATDVYLDPESRELTEEEMLKERNKP